MEPDAVDDAVRALRSAERPVVLAGPGVVHEGAVESLRILAAVGSLGVLNTWGAKGLFDWTSPHHLATVGLQERDFELGGLGEADLIIATGMDPAEALVDWRLAPVVEVAPSDLSAIASRWSRPRREIPVPTLRTELARVTQEGWSSATGPLSPTRVTLTYSEVLGADGLVVADPGLAGYWVARTFPTTRLGGAVVPASVDRPGFAATCVTMSSARQPERSALAVVDRIDGSTESVLEAAERLGLRIAVEVWADDGDLISADEHRDRLHELLRVGGVATVRTDPAQLQRMIDVAGEVVAWGGLAADGVPALWSEGEAG